jgi:hypothetical protein
VLSDVFVVATASLVIVLIKFFCSTLFAVVPYRIHSSVICVSANSKTFYDYNLSENVKRGQVMSFVLRF